MRNNAAQWNISPRLTQRHVNRGYQLIVYAWRLVSDAGTISKHVVHVYIEPLVGRFFDRLDHLVET